MPRVIILASRGNYVYPKGYRIIIAKALVCPRLKPRMIGFFLLQKCRVCLVIGE